MHGDLLGMVNCRVNLWQLKANVIKINPVIACYPVNCYFREVLIH